MALKYVGKDLASDWLPGIPARDLDDDEVKQYPEAKRSALYQETEPRKPRAKRTSTKKAAPVAAPEADVSPASDDKE